ncbi:MAG TPA: family 78 glycoside hydrolase catalytic domain [Pseudolysinimonas sp.]|nr:family 78 glycoside hydrolase catalytic domain [Pseudolysinimonas sp.]
MSETFTARMITADIDRGSAPQLRREFSLDEGHGAVSSATVYATALGLCEVSINGDAAAEDLLTPGWSSYEWRVRYATWSVEELLAADNVIGVLVGNGWHTGHLGFAGGAALYGPERAALVELRITFEDGHTQTVSTDDAWQSGPSPILADDLYNGETIDARAISSDWTRPRAELAGWGGVREIEFDHARLTPYVGPPVLRQDRIQPQRIWDSPAGKTLVDFGQNLVGWVRVVTRGDAGHTLTLRHAEVLEHDELGTRPLRTAQATDRYILSGGDDTFEPTLTFHGFRYVEVDGWQGTHDELRAAMTAIVIGSELRRIGTFECSNPKLNQLHANIVWGMRGNFVDLPTDCPQRDERLGWTGDIAAFVNTATYLFDVDLFLRDWLLDLAAEQAHDDGNIPMVVPNNFKYETFGFTPPPEDGDDTVSLIALWSDAACWVPWAIWEAYGDVDVLAQQWESISAYARRIDSALTTTGVMGGGFQLGDWLDPTAPPDAPHQSKSDAHVVATACVYRSAVIAADTATLLGHDEEAAEFAALAGRICRGFTEQFVDTGRIRSDGAAVYALAIAFDLLDGPGLQAAGDRLAELVAEADYRITTGFAGTPFINLALTKTGHLDTAYKLLLQEQSPSWLYQVNMGATTIWERWDSMLPDGTINPGEMTSFNHYAFGAIGHWMHQTIGGIAPLEPGYSQVLIAPQPGGNLSWATAHLDTPHGRVTSAWRIDGDTFILEVTVPDAVTATLRIPGADEDVLVTGGPHTVTG